MRDARRFALCLDDAAAAERAVSELMGSEVEPRKKYIQEHAKDARFLDI